MSRSEAGFNPRAIAFAALVRQARYEVGLSVSELAKLANVAPSTLSRIESGAAEASPETVRRILEACGNVTNRSSVPSTDVGAAERPKDFKSADRMFEQMLRSERD